MIVFIVNGKDNKHTESEEKVEKFPALVSKFKNYFMFKIQFKRLEGFEVCNYHFLFFFFCSIYCFTDIQMDLFNHYLRFF
jgi:hypothetical protein